MIKTRLRLKFGFDMQHIKAECLLNGEELGSADVQRDTVVLVHKSRKVYKEVLQIIMKANVNLIYGIECRGKEVLLQL